MMLVKKFCPFVLAMVLVVGSIQSISAGVTSCYDGTCAKGPCPEVKPKACAAPDNAGCIVKGGVHKCAATADFDLVKTTVCAAVEGDAKDCGCEAMDCNLPPTEGRGGGGKDPTPATPTVAPTGDGAGTGEGGNAKVIANGILVMLAASFVGWMQFSGSKL